MRSNLLFILLAILLYRKRGDYVRKGNKNIWKKEWKQIKVVNAAKLALGSSRLIVYGQTYVRLSSAPVDGFPWTADKQHCSQSFLTFTPLVFILGTIIQTLSYVILLLKTTTEHLTIKLEIYQMVKPTVST